MLKLVTLDEFTILSFLNSLKSECNHTIPILDQVPLGIEIIVAMPWEMVLAHAPDSIFETGGNILAYQFLQGVQFMHQNHVAHLDLKPDNLLLAAPMKLTITDYNTSYCVTTEDEWIKGYRGTEGWVAPELDANPHGSYQPIRADLYSVGMVLQYMTCRQHTNVKHTFKSLTNSLLSRDPQQRPLLSKIDLHSQEALELNRKVRVDEEEKGGIKRMCMGSVIPQNDFVIPALPPTP